MDRRRAILAGAVVLLGPKALAQAPGRASSRPRIVYTWPRRSDQLRNWYAEKGLVDGVHVDLVHFDFRGLSDAAMEKLAREVLAAEPNVVVTIGWKPVFLFQRLTSRVPLVFANFGGDPVKMGLVESLRRPGRNMTGSCQQLMTFVPKFFELLREIKPGGRRGGVLVTQATAKARHGQHGREEVARAATLLAMEIGEIVVPDNPSLEQVVAALDRARVDYLFVPEDIYTSPILPDFYDHVARIRLPALYLYPGLVRNGGLISMSFDVAEGHQAAIDIVARILRGESPATIPVYQAARYRVAVNRRTARAMGIELSPAILARADEVVD